MKAPIRFSNSKVSAITVLALCALTACDSTGVGTGAGSGSGNRAGDASEQTAPIVFDPIEKAQILGMDQSNIDQVLFTISDIVAKRNQNGEHHTAKELGAALDDSFTIDCRPVSDPLSNETQLCHIQQKENSNAKK